MPERREVAVEASAEHTRIAERAARPWTVAAICLGVVALVSGLAGIGNESSMLELVVGSAGALGLVAALFSRRVHDRRLEALRGEVRPFTFDDWRPDWAMTGESATDWIADPAERAQVKKADRAAKPWNTAGLAGLGLFILFSVAPPEPLLSDELNLMLALLLIIASATSVFIGWVVRERIILQPVRRYTESA